MRIENSRCIEETKLVGERIERTIYLVGVNCDPTPFGGTQDAKKCI